MHLLCQTRSRYVGVRIVWECWSHGTKVCGLGGWWSASRVDPKCRLKKTRLFEHRAGRHGRRGCHRRSSTRNNIHGGFAPATRTAASGHAAGATMRGIGRPRAVWRPPTRVRPKFVSGTWPKRARKGQAKPGATVSDYMQNTLEFAEEVVVAERTFQGVSH